MTTPIYSSRDFKSQKNLRRMRRGHFRLALGVSVLIGLAAVFILSPEAEATRAPKLNSTPLLVEDIALPDTSGPAADLPRQEEILPESVVVKPGDTLSAIFNRLGLAPTIMHSVLSAGSDAGALKNLRPGETLEFRIRNGVLQALNYTIDRTRTLAVTAEDDGFRSQLEVLTPEMRIARTSGVIVSSLYSAGLSAGLSDAIILQLAEIFGWDIDFALDLRAGDQFAVLYEESYVKGEKYSDGNILAAEFVNDGRLYRATRFTDPSGHTDYYDTDGRSMRKAFLRSPVDFRRISSHFQPERFHPVLGVKRPHRGVDYAAAIGTPIKAAGDGKVVFVGTKGGYGNTVILQHASQMSTLYGHLSRFGRAIKAGARVSQGQTIGYVGKTGLATGPHLHYEFRVNGEHRNPLTVKLPTAAPISAAYRSTFESYSKSLLAQLDVMSGAQVAANQKR